VCTCVTIVIILIVIEASLQIDRSLWLSVWLLLGVCVLYSVHYISHHRGILRIPTGKGSLPHNISHHRGGILRIPTVSSLCRRSLSDIRYMCIQDIRTFSNDLQQGHMQV
jgi:hypothetical protein